MGQKLVHMGQSLCKIGTNQLFWRNTSGHPVITLHRLLNTDHFPLEDTQKPAFICSF